MKLKLLAEQTLNLLSVKWHGDNYEQEARHGYGSYYPICSGRAG
jgi:hypothetical protein